MFTFVKLLLICGTAGVWGSAMAAAIPASGRAENPRDVTVMSEEMDFNWTSLDQMPAPRSNPAVVNAGNAVYVIGGQGPEGPTDTVWEFKPREKPGQRWRTLPNLFYPRMGHRAVAFAKRIFVVGGVSGTGKNSQVLESVESFDLEKGVWKKESSMLLPRARFGLAAVGDKIYVVGGENRDSRTLSAAESYDPHTQVWQKIKDIPQKCNRMSTVNFGNQLYVLGGESSTGAALKSVWVYAPSEKNWKPGTPLTVARKNFSAVVYDGQIVAAGGWHESGKNRKYINSVEFFSPLNQSWFVAGTLSQGRDGLRAVAFDDEVLAFGGYRDHQLLTTVESGRWYARPYSGEAPD